MDDLISRQQAIDALCSVCNALGGGHNCDKTKFVYNAPFDEQVILCPEHYALTMLPSVQPEQSACEYCHEDSDGYVLSIEKNGHAYIQNGKLALRANGWRGECGIDYCPMCGRKLRGEENETD